MKYLAVIFTMIHFGCKCQTDTVVNYSESGCIDYTDIISFDKLFKINRINFYQDSCNKIKDTTVLYRDVIYYPNYRYGSINTSLKIEVLDTINPINYGRKYPGKSMRYWGSTDLSVYSDMTICDSDTSIILRYDQNNELYFEGSCQNGKVDNGRFFFFDKDNILVWIEIWKDGKYYADGFY